MREMDLKVGEMNMTEWENDKKWADKFIPEVTEILGRCLIVVSNEEMDQKENTDLIILTTGTVRIAVRIRRPKYYKKYPDDITFRYSRPSGTKSEYEKMKDGWGDYFFYGISTESEYTLATWILIDLKQFREWIKNNVDENKCLILQNYDHSSDFIVFNRTDIPENCIFAIYKECE